MKLNKTVEAQSPEHHQLLKEGWKPVMAYQTLEHVEKYKDGYFTGHDLTPRSKLMVDMELGES